MQVQYATSVLDHTVIDSINILQATMSAMADCTAALLARYRLPTRGSSAADPPGAMTGATEHRPAVRDKRTRRGNGSFSSEQLPSSKRVKRSAAAVADLAAEPAPTPLILVDGNRLPAFHHLDDEDEVTAGAPVPEARAIVGGDASVYSIAAASIIAKVTRDRLMLQYDQQYPEYGFAQHKGYGTPAHMAAIMQHGPCPIHRRTFAPMKHMK